jgi:hypothetical protein
MQNRIFCIVAILFLSSEINAQKTVQKQWEGSAVDTILISSDEIYSVRINSEATENITLTTRVEGEFSESIIVKEFISGRTLQIDLGVSPYFNPKNDKLAAHKVISVEMTLVIPNRLAVIVHSMNASVNANGSIRFLETALENGHCVLSNFKGDARLFSSSGDIFAATQPGVGGRGISKNGQLKNELTLEGDYFIEARSLNGSVSLVRQE